MAASKPDSNPGKNPLRVMANWIAPLIAFVVVVGILLALR